MNKKRPLSPLAIRYFRKEKLKKSQDELHKLSGVSRKTITEIENNKQETVLVQEKSFTKLKEALGISSNEMLGNTLKSIASDTSTNTTDVTASQKSSSETVSDSISKVAQIYGCNAEDIIALAPLLAMHFFEKCLEKEMKVFSKDFKNNKLTRGSEYILENFFADFIDHSSKYNPAKNPNHSIGEAIDEDMENNLYRGFDSVDEIEALRADIDMCLRRKDVFLKGVKHIANLDQNASIEERHNPMDKYVRNLLEKKHIKEVFKPETSNALHDERRYGPHFKNSKVLAYNQVND